MRLAVLVKHVPDTDEPRRLDPTSGRIDRTGPQVIDETTARALAWALDLRAEHGGEVTAITMGPDNAADSLRRALALGADSAIHICDDALAGADAALTSATLAAAVRTHGADLVVAGSSSTDGGCGVVPAMIAERFGWPHVTYLVSAALVNGEITGVRAAGGLEVTAQLPAVASVTEQITEPLVPTIKGLFGARKKKIETLRMTDLDLHPAALPAPAWEVTAVDERPPRARGTIITDQGDGAARIADHLEKHQLIGR